MVKHTNLAYIDGQNLFLGTARLDKKDSPWGINLAKFRIFIAKI